MFFLKNMAFNIEYDFFSLDNVLAKQRMDGNIIISKLEPKIKIPSYFNKIDVKLDNFNYAQDIRKIIEPISRKVEKFGFSHNIFTGLYEALLNAYQHGNKFDDDKKLILGSNYNEDKLEFIVGDSGKILHKNFFRFILKHRERTDNGSSFINWYKFSGELRSNINNGTGTSFMHAYFDNIKYFNSLDTKGLGVYLAKQNKS